MFFARILYTHEAESTSGVIVLLEIKFESFYRDDFLFTYYLLSTRLCCLSKNKIAFELPRKYAKLMLRSMKNSLVLIILVVFNFTYTHTHIHIYTYIYTALHFSKD